MHLNNIRDLIHPKAKAHTVKYQGLQGFTIQGGICCPSQRLKELVVPFSVLHELIYANNRTVTVARPRFRVREDKINKAIYRPKNLRYICFFLEPSLQELMKILEVIISNHLGPR
jgi:hypothetical protein